MYFRRILHKGKKKKEFAIEAWIYQETELAERASYSQAFLVNCWCTIQSLDSDVQTLNMKIIIV